MSQTLVLVGGIIWVISVMLLIAWSFLCLHMRQVPAAVVSLACAAFVTALGLLSVWSLT